MAPVRNVPQKRSVITALMVWSAKSSLARLRISRELPAGMFGASGNALMAGEACGDAGKPAPATAPHEWNGTL